MIEFLSTSPTICAILIFSMFIMLIGFSSWIESKNGTSKIEVQTISKEPLKHVSSIDLCKLPRCSHCGSTVNVTERSWGENDCEVCANE